MDSLLTLPLSRSIHLEGQLAGLTCVISGFFQFRHFSIHFRQQAFQLCDLKVRDQMTAR